MERAGVEKWSSLKANCEGEPIFREYQGHSKNNGKNPSEYPNPVKWKVFEVEWDEIHSKQDDPAISDHSNQKRLNKSENPNDRIEVDLSEEVEEERHIFEKHAIIGRIVGPKFPRKTIRTWIDKNWGKHVIVKFLLKGSLIADFAEAKEKDITLSKQNWFLETHPLYLQLWCPNFDPTSLAIYDGPVWVRLYNLPIEYWSEPSLEKIGRSLGTLLDIDEDIIGADLYTCARLKIAASKQKSISTSLAKENSQPNRDIAKPISEVDNQNNLTLNQEEKVDGIPDSGSESSGPDDNYEHDDELNNLDPRCISQSANTLLGRVKGLKGRKSHKTIREQTANEKGLVSVLEYMKVSKGGNPSLGER
ncbi:hypothetical protein SUGI_1165400 [Cryptomeria japonica]|nr:hypothetical protein SUGI_1165400 [Cryptomeria japonica]